MLSKISVLLLLSALALAAAQSPSCVCPTVYSPVCGVNGRTYSNACYARCDHVSIAYHGACRPGGGGNPGCYCSTIYRPVCAITNVLQQTYSNACRANCAQARIICHGPCPCHH